jgi:hypothetical protein
MRGRLFRCGLIMAALVTTSGALGLTATPATAATAAATAPAATPACTFDGSTIPIVTGVTNGSKVVIACTGLTPVHPYLLLQASLLIGIDPKAAALLSGGSTVSPATFQAALAALPEINPASLTPLLSGVDGSLNETYTVPSVQPTDANASCPPNVEEFNSGLIGCALAMVDLTTQKPVAAGSGVLEWAGYSFLPPDPTMAFSSPIAQPGGQVTVSDASGATTYWWLATLAALEALLAGGTPPPETYSVAFGAKHHTFVMATQNITAAPASYDGTTLTPPKLSGTFTVPSGLSGKHKVYVSLSMPLEGLTLEITAEQPLIVAGHH